MAPLYGEGANAFLRLQLEILAKTDDESIFAWFQHSHRADGLLADSPSQFASSGKVLKRTLDVERPPTVMTSRGLRLEMLMKWENEDEHPSKPRFLVPLNCITSDDLSFIALTFEGWGSTFKRRPGVTLLNSGWTLEDLLSFQRKLIYVKQDFNEPSTLRNPISWAGGIFLGVRCEFLSRIGFSGKPSSPGRLLCSYETKGILEWHLLSKVDVFTKARDPAFIITFSKEKQKLVVVLGFCTRGGLWIDAIYTAAETNNQQTLSEIGRNCCKKWHGKIGPDRVSVFLSEEGTYLSISLKRQIVSGTLMHIVRIVDKGRDGPSLVLLPGLGG